MQRIITVRELETTVDDIDKLEEPIIVKRENKQDLVVISLEQYQKFEEIQSVHSDGELLDNMIKRFEKGEFSHLIFKDNERLDYDKNKALELVERIKSIGVTISCADEERIVEGRKKSNDYTRE